MIDQESMLKVQAYLDDELDAAESVEVAAWLDREPEARALYNELSGVQRILVSNEPELNVPDSREFYWSKIERAILQESAKPEVLRAAKHRYPWWVRILAPALCATVVLAVGLSVLRLGTEADTLSYLHEIETPMAETSAISFRSQSAGVTVVWVQTEVY